MVGINMPSVTYNYLVDKRSGNELPVIVDYKYDDKDDSMVTGKVTVSQIGRYGPWTYSFEAVLADHRSEDGLDGGRILALTVKADAYNRVVLAYDYKWVNDDYSCRDQVVLAALMHVFN